MIPPRFSTETDETTRVPSRHPNRSLTIDIGTQSWQSGYPRSSPIYNWYDVCLSSVSDGYFGDCNRTEQRLKGASSKHVSQICVG